MSGVCPMVGPGYINDRLLLPEVQESHPTLAVHLFPQDLRYPSGQADQGNQVSPAEEQFILDQWRDSNRTPAIPNDHVCFETSSGWVTG